MAEVNPAQDFEAAMMPERAWRGRVNVVLVSSVALSFISFWRVAAIVLCDLASTAYYIGGISEQAVGKAAPWFILGVMCFSYAVRAVYMESCALFTRGGVYRVVKEAMGGFLAKLSVSALLFDFVLTGPISAVAAGQYLLGLLGSVLAVLPPPLRVVFDTQSHPEMVRLASAAIALCITAYFWRLNIIGIGESSRKALRIMILTGVMGVVVIVWCLVTVLVRPEVRQLPPLTPVLTAESAGWLANLPRMLGVFGIAIAFGHTLLAMSGEEALAQVYREIRAPKVPNLKRAAFVIFVFSFLLTGVVSFFAFMIVPDRQRITTEIVQADKTTVVNYVEKRADPRGGSEWVGVLEDGGTVPVPPDAKVVRKAARFTDNLISGLAMNVAGPQSLRLALQVFVVFVGFVILSGAVNTSVVGANGVLNRLAEDGVLTPWFLHPQKKFGTTHRVINLVAGLQAVTILASMGDVYVLGEAYAFGVIWSFVFNALGMIMLRFRRREPREFAVPLNVGLRTRSGRRIDLPIGVGIVFMALLSTAALNLLTKKVATVWGLGFTLTVLAAFLVFERIMVYRRGAANHEHVEEFNEQVAEQADPRALNLAHPDPILVAIRNPQSVGFLRTVLRRTDTAQRDVVVITCRLLPKGTGEIVAPAHLNKADRELLTRVVTVAENLGKTVHPVVVATNNPLFAIAKAACDLDGGQVVLGVSQKMYAETQLEEFALAWGMATADTPPRRPLTVTILGPQVELSYVIQ